MTRAQFDEFNTRRSTPRNSVPDPTRLILWPLMPLLLANAAMWKLYAQNGWIAGAWFIAFIASIVFLRKS